MWAGVPASPHESGLLRRSVQPFVRCRCSPPALGVSAEREVPSRSLSSPPPPLQDIAKDLPRGEESLRRLEEQAKGVIRNTSPLGAEKITRELEEMRQVLEKLRGLCEEEEGRLRGLLESTGAFERRRAQLEAELGEFRKGLRRLAEEGLPPAAKAGTEDELVARWRLYSVSRVGLRHAVQAAEAPWGVALSPHSAFPGSWGVNPSGVFVPICQKRRLRPGEMFLSPSS